ncbi:BrnT family toxin [Novosphingobium sp.]|uniref:BrnT family toxin n=1 Tax=Novosphingobium sp. TaxID=1874826 RepID=UPI00333F42D3
MDVEFDPTKNVTNLAKHGVALDFGTRVFADDDHIVFGSMRPIDGEERFKAVGLIEGRLWTAVHVFRGNVIRMISVRRSNPGEEKAYYRHSG